MRHLVAGLMERDGARVEDHHAQRQPARFRQPIERFLDRLPVLIGGLYPHQHVGQVRRLQGPVEPGDQVGHAGRSIGHGAPAPFVAVPVEGPADERLLGEFQADVQRGTFDREG